VPATEPATDLSTYRRGRVPREIRREQILALAEALFAEQGYTAASMDELARRAGVSKPMIYHLVGSKDEVFGACMARTADELASRISSAVRGEQDLRDRLLAGARAWFGFVAERRALWTALLSGNDAPITDEVVAMRQRQAELVAGLLAESAPSGAAPQLVEVVAHLINGAFEALGRWGAEHPEMPASALAQLCTDVLFPGLMRVGAVP
jgi:AcrR family transcriptional regulator